MATLWPFFDAHSKCAGYREKGIGQDPCVEKKQCQICDNFSEDQKKQLATPTYRARKELQKKASSPSHAVDPENVVLFVSSLKSLVTYCLPSGSYSAIVHWIGCINAIKLQI